MYSNLIDLKGNIQDIERLKLVLRSSQYKNNWLIERSTFKFPKSSEIFKASDTMVDSLVRLLERERQKKTS